MVLPFALAQDYQIIHFFLLALLNEFLKIQNGLDIEVDLFFKKRKRKNYLVSPRPEFIPKNQFLFEHSLVGNNIDLSINIPNIFYLPQSLIVNFCFQQGQAINPQPNRVEVFLGPMRDEVTNQIVKPAPSHQHDTLPALTFPFFLFFPFELLILRHLTF